MRKYGKYRVLREACVKMGIENADIAEVIGRTPVYVSQRITGKRPWGQDEMFKIMDMKELTEKMDKALACEEDEYHIK